MNTSNLNIFNLILPLILAPLLLGIINKTKAFFAGRKGIPLFQAYYDIIKLFKKGSVYSKTTTSLFKIAPLIVFVCTLFAIAIIPLLKGTAILAFEGDLFLFAYILGLSRFFTIVAALDTGSSFEGMGGSREGLYLTLSEPVLFISLAVLAIITQSLSFSSIASVLDTEVWLNNIPSLFLVFITLFIILLIENSRIPFDDPATHLELTMIHEVMVLDYSGIDYGLILYSIALKLWLFISLILTMLPKISSTGLWFIDAAETIILIFTISVLIGIIESVIARARFPKIPKLIVGSGILAATALVLVLW